MAASVIKSFKHDGSSHRMWMYLTFIKETRSFYYLGAERAKVIEDDGREWRAREGAIYILSKDRFYNVIVMFPSDGSVEYYVNIASPTIEKDGIYEFVDYDLDLKKDLKGGVREIDWGDFKNNSAQYGYSDKLKDVLVKTLYETEKLLRNGEAPFEDEENRKLYASFLPSASLFGQKA